jgi:hypothetical protein
MNFIEFQDIFNFFLTNNDSPYLRDIIFTETDEIIYISFNFMNLDSEFMRNVLPSYYNHTYSYSITVSLGYEIDPLSECVIKSYIFVTVSNTNKKLILKLDNPTIGLQRALFDFSIDSSERIIINDTETNYSKLEELKKMLFRVKTDLSSSRAVDSFTLNKFNTDINYDQWAMIINPEIYYTYFNAESG